MKDRQGLIIMTQGGTMPYRWYYLALGAVGLLFVGVIYSWSILKVPLMLEFRWSDADLAMNYTISITLFCIGSLVSGLLSKKITPRWLMWIGGLMILSGFVLTAVSVGTAAQLYLSYGVLVGGGIGIAYNVLLSTVNAWFPDKKGTSSGLLMMGFGLSSLVLGRIMSVLFDISEIGWRRAYIGLGCAIAFVLLLCGLILKKPSPSNIVLPAAKKAEKSQEGFEVRDYTPKEMLFRPTFWIYYIFGMLSASVGSAVISFARELSISLGATVAFATLLVGLLSLCNGLGRVLCGLAFDFLGRRRTMLLTSAITAIAPALMLLAILRGSLPSAVISLALTGISYGSNPTISSALISAFYGMRDYSVNYSISNTKLMFSSLSAIISTALFASTGGYLAPFALLFGQAVIALILCFLIRHP